MGHARRGLELDQRMVFLIDERGEGMYKGKMAEKLCALGEGQISEQGWSIR